MPAFYHGCPDLKTFFVTSTILNIEFKNEATLLKKSKFTKPKVCLIKLEKEFNLKYFRRHPVIKKS